MIFENAHHQKSLNWMSVIVLKDLHQKNLQKLNEIAV